MTETKPGAPPDLSRGSFSTGVILSVVCQGVTWIIFHFLGNRLFRGWGEMLWSVLQWPLVVPLYFTIRKQEQAKTAKALMTTSLIGVAVNASLVFLLLFELSDVLEHLP